MALNIRKLTVIKNCVQTTSYQSVRCKGEKHPNRENWKPIPPKSRRDDYFMIRAPFRWEKPLLDYQQRVVAAGGAEAAAKEPSPMHVVTRVKSLRGQMNAYKALCQHFGIHDKMHNPVLVANTQSNNELLMQIKHIIRVKPFSAPDGLPTKPSEMKNTQLRTDGSLRIIKEIGGSQGTTPVIEEKRTRLLTGQTVKASNRRKVDTHQILSEYYKTHYTYKYNEDGKEFPYKPEVGK